MLLEDTNYADGCFISSLSPVPERIAVSFTIDPYTEYSIKWYTEEVLHGVLLLRVDGLLEAARYRELLGADPRIEKNRCH
jgi:hypothetical protein